MTLFCCWKNIYKDQPTKVIAKHYKLSYQGCMCLERQLKDLANIVHPWFGKTPPIIWRNELFSMENAMNHHMPKHFPTRDCLKSDCWTEGYQHLQELPGVIEGLEHDFSCLLSPQGALLQQKTIRSLSQVRQICGEVEFSNTRWTMQWCSKINAKVPANAYRDLGR